MKLTAKEVIMALKKRHKDRNEWGFFEELRCGTGYSNYKIGNHVINPEQRFDAFAINLYPSNKHLRIAYEVKVSRSDFLHEIKNPEKRKSALIFSNEFYFVVPTGLVKKEEIPNECGLIYVSENLGTRTVKQAPFRNSSEPSWNFLATIARRSQQEEGR